jgi:hypothetical protein
MKAESYPSETATTSLTGQTIFHPDDGVSLSLVQVKCATCQGPNFLYPQTRADELVDEVSVSAYRYACSKPSCVARVTMRVSQGQAALPPALTALQGSTSQTIFHPDDGVRLAEVSILCDACNRVPLLPQSKKVEDVQSGRWTAYTYGCQQAGCSAQLILRVCQKTGQGEDLA